MVYRSLNKKLSWMRLVLPFAFLMLLLPGTCSSSDTAGATGATRHEPATIELMALADR